MVQNGKNPCHRKQQNFFHPPFLWGVEGLSVLLGVNVSAFFELFLDWRVGLFRFNESVNLRALRRAVSNTSFKFFWVSAEHSMYVAPMLSANLSASSMGTGSSL